MTNTFQRHGILMVISAMLSLAFWIVILGVGFSYFSVIEANTSQLIKAAGVVLLLQGPVFIAAIINGVKGMDNVL